MYIKSMYAATGRTRARRERPAARRPGAGTVVGGAPRTGPRCLCATPRAAARAGRAARRPAAARARARACAYAPRAPGDDRGALRAGAAAEEEALGLLRELSAQGAPEWAHVAARGGGGAGFLVTSGWSQRAPADGGKRAFARTFDVDASADASTASALETTSPSAAELPSSGVELRSVSPSGARSLSCAYRGNGGGAKGARVAQLWTAAGLQWEAAVPARCTVPCARANRSVAQTGRREAPPLRADAPRRVRAAVSAAAPLAAVSTADKSEADGDKASVTGRTWEPTQDYAPDWGEAQGGAREAALFVVDCASGALARVAVPDAQDLEPSAAHADGEQSAPSAGAVRPALLDVRGGLAFTAWPHPAGHRPGLAHCLNRPSAVCWAPSPHAADASGEAAIEGDVEGGRGGALVVATAGRRRCDGGGSRLYFLSHACTGDGRARRARTYAACRGAAAARPPRARPPATQDVLDVRAADSAKGCPPDGLWVTRLRRDMSRCAAAWWPPRSGAPRASACASTSKRARATRC